MVVVLDLQRGMKLGALAGTFIGGPIGATIGGILGGILGVAGSMIVGGWQKVHQTN